MKDSVMATNVASYPLIDIEELKRKGNTFRGNAGASIIDIGDRIGLLEFHTKANAISDEIVEMLFIAGQEATKKFDALVIGNRGRHFSAGANLSFLLELARGGDWSRTDQIFRRLQDANMLLKYGPIPVVAAAFSNALGGGAEIVLHSDKVVAAVDLHLGLVEAGVGLIPAGGGTKELRLRAMDHFGNNGNGNLIDAIQEVFKMISSGKVSTDGEEAKRFFLLPTDQVTDSSQPPIELAKQVALDMVKAGYKGPEPMTAIPMPGRTGISIFRNRIDYMLHAKEITEHDAVIARHIANILCGGDVASGTAGEQHFLDLEREAFISLLGTPKTQERIEYLLKNNKRLHN
jgi:3-hydroxyacyl-CoA dehydrogenase